MKNFVIEFDEMDGEAAFFALYAGLRMYSEMKQQQHAGLDSMSIAGAEAYCLIQNLKDAYPKESKEAEQEYDEAGISKLICANNTIPNQAPDLSPYLQGRLDEMEWEDFEQEIKKKP